MKLKTFLAMMAVGCLATGFTSCDDDDDDDTAIEVVAPEIAGKYFGMGTETVMGRTGEDYTYYTNFVAQGNGKFTITLPESTEIDTTSSMAMPTIELKDMTFTAGTNNTFEIDEPTVVLNLPNGKTANISKLHITFDATAKAVSFSYNIQYGNMPFPIAYTFNTLKKNDFVCGDFLGTNAYTVMGSTTTDSTSVFNILPQENGKYTIVFPSAENKQSVKSRAGMEMPAISLKDVEISGNENKFSFEIESASAESPREDGTMMTISLKNLKGSIYNNKLTVNYSMQPGNMPFPLTFSYEGSKQIKK